MVHAKHRALITLGFVVAIGLPLLVLVAAILWPEPTAGPTEDERNSSRHTVDELPE